MPRIKPKERAAAERMLLKRKSTREICDALNVTPPFVYEVAKRAGLHTPKHTAFLNLTCSHCGKNFKRKKSVQDNSDRTAKRKGMKRMGRYCTRDCWIASVQWPPEDEKILKDNFRKLSHIEIGKLLGRSPVTVSDKARQIGLRYFKEHGSDLVNRIKGLKRRHTHAEIAKIVGLRSRDRVRYIVQYNGLSAPAKEYVKHCRNCGCPRSKTCRGDFRRGMCHRCVAILAKLNYDEELMEIHEMAEELAVAAGKKPTLRIKMRMKYRKDAKAHARV